MYWEGIDPWKAQETGLWDYARAKQGGVDVVFEHLWLEDGFNNYDVVVKHACRLIETFYRVLDANRDKMELALTAADARRIVKNGKMAVVLVLEGGFDMDGDLDVLRLFHRLGVRMVQFVNHDTTNAFADAYAGEQKWQGINDRGRAIIREMNRLGIIIDISHAAEATQLQAIEASRAPVAASHQSQRRFSNHLQNLTDDVLKALAAKKGVSGVQAWAGTLSQQYYDWFRNRPRTSSRPPLPNVARSPNQDYGSYITTLDAEMKARWSSGYTIPWRQHAPPDAPLPTVQDWADQVDYAVKLVGPEYVGLGLDLTLGDRALRDFDATGYPRLTEALVAKGYPPATVKQILGENWLRLLDAAKVPGATDTPGR